jgi:transposase-like protein
MKRYGTESQCAEALFQARWPSGFQCPGCGGRRYSVIKTRNLYQCTTCHHQTSLISGTLFEQTKLPLTTWFLAIHMLTQAKTALSALALMRQIGVSYNTAWSLKHKIMQAMKERDDRKPRPVSFNWMMCIGVASIGAENADEARKIRRPLLRRWR